MTEDQSDLGPGPRPDPRLRPRPGLILTNSEWPRTKSEVRPNTLPTANLIVLYMVIRVLTGGVPSPGTPPWVHHGCQTPLSGGLRCRRCSGT